MSQSGRCFSYYTYGTRVHNCHENPTKHASTEYDISISQPNYNHPKKDLIFEFINNVVLEADGPEEDPTKLMIKVKQQIIEDISAPYKEVIAILVRGDDLNQEGHVYQVARNTLNKTGGNKDNAIALTHEWMMQKLEKLNEEFRIIDQEVTPFVIRDLLSRMDLNGWYEHEEEQQEKSSKSRNLIRAFLLTKRDDPSHALEPNYIAEPKLQVRVDPNWDEHLPDLAAQKKQDILQHIICWLGKKFPDDIQHLHLSRITKTLYGFRVWFINESSPSMEWEPISVDVHAVDLNQTHIAELVRHESSNQITQNGKENPQQTKKLFAAMESVTEAVKKSLNAPVLLEMDLSLTEDYGIQEAYQKAQARLTALKASLVQLDGRYIKLTQKIDPQVEESINEHPENINQIQQMQHLREKIYTRVDEQINVACQKYQKLNDKINQSAQFFHENTSNDNEADTKKLIAEPLHSTVSEFFRPSQKNGQQVFMKLLELLYTGKNPSEIAAADMLIQYVENNLNKDQLIEKINTILSEPKTKEGRSFYLFVRDLIDQLKLQSEKHPAFIFTKKGSEAAVSFSEELMIKQMQRAHESEVAACKRALLEAINKVGRADDDLHVYKEKMRHLEDLYKKETNDLEEIKKFCEDYNQYVDQMNSTVKSQVETVELAMDKFLQGNKVLPAAMNDPMIVDTLNSIRVQSQLIQSYLSRITNFVHSIESSHKGNGNLLHFEDRLNKNKATIESEQVKMQEQIANLMAMTKPYGLNEFATNKYSGLYSNSKKKKHEEKRIVQSTRSQLSSSHSKKKL